MECLLHFLQRIPVWFALASETSERLQGAGVWCGGAPGWPGMHGGGRVFGAF
jgi:hypothetical protein